MTTQTESTAAVLEQLQTARNRRSELERLSREAEQSIEDRRSAIGRAIAAGSGAEALQADLRRLRDDADGYEQALPILAQEIADLEARLADSQRDDANRAFAAKSAALGERIEALSCAVKEFAESIDPDLRQLWQMTADARLAEKESDRLIGRPPAPGSSRTGELWKAVPGLQGLVLGLDGYRRGDLVDVTPLNDKRQPITWDSANRSQ